LRRPDPAADREEASDESQDEGENLTDQFSNSRC
jgi:hypothetical protein